MLAKAAFLVGAMLELESEIIDITEALPFLLAKRNLYLATLLWSIDAHEVPARADSNPRAAG